MKDEWLRTAGRGKGKSRFDEGGNKKRSRGRGGKIAETDVSAMMERIKSGRKFDVDRLPPGLIAACLCISNVTALLP